jgi:hypothetical protein
LLATYGWLPRECPQWVESGHLYLIVVPLTMAAMRATLLSIVLLFGAASCGTGERPFRMVQFCLSGTHEIDELKTVVRSIAASNGLMFQDRSADAERELTAIAERSKDLPVAHPTLVISARAPDGMGFSAGNFPDAASQIVVGFSKADDDGLARRLSENVVNTLEKRWRIREVPNVAESGASPLKECVG